jgi:hypothetical protein
MLARQVLRASQWLLEPNTEPTRLPGTVPDFLIARKWQEARGTGSPKW